MPVVVTAGHVDHGKSTLVRALTGRDPDRWEEEKRRGLTIDLGFAWTTLPSGHEVAFVDVPGHERFVKNMLAGVGAVEVALFVVAADEGWMPQSEEHLAVLDLLDVSHGVVALTRVDLVDDDLLELAVLEVEEQIAGTSLEGWPVIPVSGVTGEGLDVLAEALGTALAAAGEPRDGGRPRLWIDRAFTIRGAGVVVTGTLAEGGLRVGDELVVAPRGPRLRIRGLHRHERPVAEVLPGNRVALDVVGEGVEDLRRGMLLTAPGATVPARRFAAVLRGVRSVDPPTDRGAYHLHLGTGAFPVRLRILSAGPPIRARIDADEELPLRIGDRFVVRETGRRAVVGGGRVVDPLGVPVDEEAWRELVEALDDPRDRAAALVRAHGSLERTVLDAAAGALPEDAVVVGELVVAEETTRRIRAEARELVAAFHERYPLRPGIPKAELASRLGVSARLVDAVVAETDLVDDGASVRLAEFSPRLADADRRRWEEAVARLGESLAVPRVSSLGLPDELLHAQVRAGELVVVGDDLAYLPRQLDEIVSRLGELPDGFTVSEFRRHFGLARRQAVPLLEWLDAEGWTRRDGDLRRLSRPGPPRAGDAPPR